MDQSRRKRFKLLTATLFLCFLQLRGIFDPIRSAEKTTPAVLGQQQSDIGEWQKAITHFDKAIASSPYDSSLLARRGYAYANLGKYKKAFQDFDIAIKCDTNNPDAYTLRARAHAWLGLGALSKEDAKKSLALTKLIDQKNPRLMMERAGNLMINQNLKEGYEEYKKVLALVHGKKDLPSLIIAMRAHSTRHEDAKALKLADQALKIAPHSQLPKIIKSSIHVEQHYSGLALKELKSIDANNLANTLHHSMIGTCYYYLDDNPKALEAFNLAIKLEPKNAYALTMRGKTYHYMGDYKKAIDSMSSAINLDSSDPQRYIDRSDNYGHEKDWKNALADAEKAILTDPKFSNAYVQKGLALHNLKRDSEAAIAYEKGVEVDPNNPTAFFNRGMHFRENKEYRKAIDDLTKAIKLNPANAIYYCARGSAYVSDFKYEHAIYDCSRSLKLNSRRTHPHFSRGIAFAKLGDYKSAIRDFNEAIRQYPDYGEAYYERGLIYKTLQLKNKSKSDLDKAEKLGHKSPEAM